MQNIVLTIHLLLAIALIISVLLQRSEGGGLGIGGGGGVMSGRPPSTPMAKVTWVLALCFIGTSLGLTWIATRESAGNSVIERVSDTPAPQEQPAQQGGTAPSSGNDSGLTGTLTPPSSDGPAVPPPVE